MDADEQAWNARERRRAPNANYLENARTAHERNLTVISQALENILGYISEMKEKVKTELDLPGDAKSNFQAYTHSRQSQWIGGLRTVYVTFADNHPYLQDPTAFLAILDQLSATLDGIIRGP